MKPDLSNTSYRYTKPSIKSIKSFTVTFHDKDNLALSVTVDDENRTNALMKVLVDYHTDLLMMEWDSITVD